MHENDEKVFVVMVTRSVTEEGWIDVRAFAEDKYGHHVVYGYASKNGDKLRKFWAGSCYDTSKYEKGLVAIVHVPLRFMKTAVAAVAHVLSGHSPDDFFSDLYVESDLGKEIARMFQKAADEGCIPVEIRPSLEMMSRLMKILAPSGSRRLVCAF